MADTKTGDAASTSSGTTDTTGTTEGTGTTDTTGTATSDAGKTGGDGTGTTGDGKDGKPEGKQGTETTGKEGTGDGTPKAPEKYDLKITEGGELYYGAEDLAFIEEVARANDWTNEEAQAEIDAMTERAIAREKAQGEKLLAAFKADKEYGGDKLETTQRQARAAIDKVFPEGHRLRGEFLKAFERGIVGNNLVYVAFLAEVGRAMGEDAPGMTRSAASRSSESAADKLYDHPDSKALDGRT